jgi:hypothetical protein
MRERNISEEEVERVLYAHGQEHPTLKKRKVRDRTTGGALVEVVYTKPAMDLKHVVTVKRIR